MILEQLDHVLIIDNEPAEVEGLIKMFNEQGTSTSYIQNPVKAGIEFNENTRLVILDLYLGSNEKGHQGALDAMIRLSKRLIGPYIVLVWSKNNFSAFEKDLNKMLEDFPQYNFPVLIQSIDSNEFNKGINNKGLLTHISDLVTAKFKKNKNIKAMFDFIFFGNKNVKNIWEFININNEKENKTLSSLTTNLNAIIGVLFQTTDIAFGYEKSGKGLLKFKNSLIEENLNSAPIKYYNKEIITEDLRLKANGLISTHKTSKKFPNYRKPGLIIKSGIKGCVKPINILKTYFKDMNKKSEKITQDEDKSWIYKKSESNSHKFNASVVYLIITADCDFSCNKNSSTLIVESLLINDIIGSTKGNGKTSFLNEMKRYNILQISPETSLVYNVKNFYTIDKDIKIKYNNVESFYLDKECVENIRHCVTTDISRVGLSTIQIIKEEKK